MKTSNKILLGLITFIGLCCLCFLIYAKSQMIDNSNTEWDDRNFQSSRQQRTYEYNNLDFKSLDLSGNHNYVLVQGPNQVTIRSEGNYQGLWKPKVEDGVLSIIIETDKDLSDAPGFDITISAKNIDKININGKASLITPSPINVENITVTASGPTNSTLDLNAKTVKVNGNGNAYIHLQGSTEKLDAQVNGPAQLDAGSMKSTEVTLNAGGSSYTQINAEKRLNINAADTAEVVYEGNPELTKKLSNSASVIQKSTEK